jgi:hypothetical protein
MKITTEYIFLLVALQLMVRLSAFVEAQRIQTWRRLMTPTPRRFFSVQTVQPFPVFSSVSVIPDTKFHHQLHSILLSRWEINRCYLFTGSVLKRPTQSLAPYGSGGSWYRDQLSRYVYWNMCAGDGQNSRYCSSLPYFRFACSYHFFLILIHLLANKKVGGGSTPGKSKRY